MNNLEMLKFLKNSHADLFFKEKYYGEGALHQTLLEFQNTNTIKWLINECALDVNAKNNEGETPFLSECVS